MQTLAFSTPLLWPVSNSAISLLFAAHAAHNVNSSLSSSNAPGWASPSSEPSCSLELLKEVSDVCNHDAICGTDGIRSDSMVFNFLGTTCFHESNTRPLTVIYLWCFFCNSTGCHSSNSSAKLNKFLAAFEIDLYDLMVFGFAWGNNYEIGAWRSLRKDFSSALELSSCPMRRQATKIPQIPIKTRNCPSRVK